MKKLLVLSLFLVVGALCANDNVAVLKPDQTCSINIPKGVHSPVYFSKDCSVAYVLPSQKIKKTIFKPYFIGTAGACERYEQASTIADNYKKMTFDIVNHVKQLKHQSRMETNLKKIIKINDQILAYNQQLIELNKLQNNIYKPFYESTAVRAQIRVESDILDEVSLFKAANIQNASLKIVPAEIGDAYLAISKKSNLETSALGTSFAGTVSSKDIDNVILIKMNGQMNGIVDLSTATYCEAIRKSNDSATEEKELRKVFDSAVAINMDYEVRLQAGVKVNIGASLESDFLAQFQKKLIKKSYTKQGLIQELVNENLINKLLLKVDYEKDEEFSMKDLLAKDLKDSNAISSLGPMVGEFVRLFSNQLYQKLTDLKIINSIDKLDAEELEANVSRDSEICDTRKISWMPWADSVCKSETVFVKINNEIIADLLNKNIEISLYNQEMGYEPDRTILIKNTSAFILE